MKLFSPYLLLILFFSLVFGFAGNVLAANLDGHMQYSIISYSFNGDDNSESSSANKRTLLISDATSNIFNDSSQFNLNEPKPATDVLAVSAEFFATPDLSLHGAFGVTKNRYGLFEKDNDASWEANLGVIYKLFNNIRYEVHFGYMDTGDLFKESNSYTDVESIIMISNKLTMGF